jgi:hypothetical protein
MRNSSWAWMLATAAIPMGRRGTACGRTRSSITCCVEPPYARDALQLVFTTIVEVHSGARDKISDSARDQDLTRLSCRCDACSDVNGDADEIAAALLTLTCMNPQANLKAQLPNMLPDRDRALHGTSGAIKSDEKAIPSCGHLSTTEAADLFSNNCVMLRQNSTPAVVADLCRMTCRVHDVCEQHGRENSARFGGDFIGNLHRTFPTSARKDEHRASGLGD